MCLKKKPETGLGWVQVFAKTQPEPKPGLDSFIYKLKILKYPPYTYIYIYIYKLKKKKKTLIPFHTTQSLSCLLTFSSPTLTHPQPQTLVLLLQSHFITRAGISLWIALCSTSPPSLSITIAHFANLSQPWTARSGLASSNSISFNYLFFLSISLPRKCRKKIK